MPVNGQDFTLCPDLDVYPALTLWGVKLKDELAELNVAVLYCLAHLQRIAVSRAFEISRQALNVL